MARHTPTGADANFMIRFTSLACAILPLSAARSLLRSLQRSSIRAVTLPVTLLAATLVSGCSALPVQRLATSHDHAVAYWGEVGAATVLATRDAAPATPEERVASLYTDMATLHIAIYDALCAIDRRYEPYAAREAGVPQASPDAAIGAAAHTVLLRLFPSRATHYAQAYRSFLAKLPDDPATASGLALGKRAAETILSLRADDGRAVELAPYRSHQETGRFRGIDPINRYGSAIKPFALLRVDQFRPPPPPRPGSDAFLAELAEVRARGGRVSSVRTPAQWEAARFHAEVPGPFLIRNLSRFARSSADSVDAARLMALVYVSTADAMSACFEAKYYYDYWRPATAIAAADAGSPGVPWSPSLPTPNHPEYPAAHSCGFAAVGETLRHYYGSTRVEFTMDSRATGNTRTYHGTNALSEESSQARVDGGMHFRSATLAGVKLGTAVADWVARHHFRRKAR